MRRLIVGSSIVLIGIICFRPSFAEEIPSRVSVTDKEIIERLTRLETCLEEAHRASNKRIDDLNVGLNKRIDDVNLGLGRRLDNVNLSLSKRIDDVNAGLSGRIDEVNVGLGKRIDDLQATMRWWLGILSAMIVGLFGYIVWDRRSALHPLLEKTSRLEKLVDAHGEYSRSDPN